MPRKKSTRRKRRTRRKRKSRVPRPRLPINGFPAKFTCVHRYADVITIAASANLNHVGSHTFNVSSLYDPDITGTGSQPRGRDQLVNIYNRYCVIGAKVRFRPVGPSTLTGSTNYGTAGMEYGGALTEASGFVSSNWGDVIEQWGYRQNATINNDIGTSKTLTRTYSLRKFLKHPSPLSDDVVTSASSTAPSKGAYFHVWCANPTGQAMPAVSFSVTIDFITVWFRRLPITAS